MWQHQNRMLWTARAANEEDEHSLYIWKFIFIASTYALTTEVSRAEFIECSRSFCSRTHGSMKERQSLNCLPTITQQLCVCVLLVRRALLLEKRPRGRKEEIIARDSMVGREFVCCFCCFVAFVATVATIWQQFGTS